MAVLSGESQEEFCKFQDYSKVLDLFIMKYWASFEKLSNSDVVGRVGYALKLVQQFSEFEYDNQDVSCNRLIPFLKHVIDNKQSFKSSESIIKYLTSYSNTASFELTSHQIH